MESPASEVLPQEQRIPRQWGTLKKEWNKLPKLTQDQKKRVKAALKFVKAKSNIERDFDLIVTVSSLRGLFGYQTPSQANSGPEEAGQGGHHVHGSQVECRKGLRRNCYRCLPPGNVWVSNPREESLDEAVVVKEQDPDYQVQKEEGQTYRGVAATISRSGSSKKALE